MGVGGGGEVGPGGGGGWGGGGALALFLTFFPVSSSQTTHCRGVESIQFLSFFFFFKSS